MGMKVVANKRIRFDQAVYHRHAHASLKYMSWLRKMCSPRVLGLEIQQNLKKNLKFAKTCFSANFST